MTLRFPASISPRLWKQNRQPETPKSDLDIQLDRLSPSETSAAVQRVLGSSLSACERLHTAYITLRITSGRVSITGIIPISTTAQRIEFTNKGAIASITGGRYDDDVKALIAGPPNEHFRPRSAAL